ncbi:MAG: RnfABCDGE type electron transport complex subunit B [bacterium]
MIEAIFVLGILGFILAIILAFAFKKLRVEVDPKEEEIMKILPGANCGVCGFSGCSGFTHALLAKEEVSCPAGGSETKLKIASILGIEITEKDEKKAIVKCRGSFPEAKEKFIYDGLDDCKAANLVAEGRKNCIYGCIGLGTCIKSCPFGAISKGNNHLPVINRNKCTGCGKCIKNCPKKVISLELNTRKVYVFCNSNDKGILSRKNCKYACIACGLCVKQCEFDAIKLENNLAIIDSNKCTNCKKCIEKCPTKTLVEIN